MTIIRVEHHTKSFTCISNATLEDARLSYRARGLLGALLCKPDGWEISRAQLVKGGTETAHGVAVALAELRDGGYLTQEPVQLEGGRMAGSVVVVRERPTSQDLEPTEVERSSSLGPIGPLVSNIFKEEASTLERPSSRKKPRTHVPETFPISGDLANWTLSVLRREVVAQERDQFLDYHRARNSLFADWNSAWRTWARNAVKYRPEVAAPKAGAAYGDGSGNNGLFALIEENRPRPEPSPIPESSERGAGAPSRPLKPSGGTQVPNRHRDRSTGDA